MVVVRLWGRRCSLEAAALPRTIIDLFVEDAQVVDVVVLVDFVDVVGMEVGVVSCAALRVKVESECQKAVDGKL